MDASFFCLFRIGTDTTFSFSIYPEERRTHGFPWHPEKVRIGPARFFPGATP
jgi:hypothetical protein